MRNTTGLLAALAVGCTLAAACADHSTSPLGAPSGGGDAGTGGGGGTGGMGACPPCAGPPSDCLYGLLPGEGPCGCGAMCTPAPDGGDGADPSSGATYPEGYLAWQISGGAVAMGAAWVVSAEGWAKRWSPVPYFGSNTPPPDPAATHTLTKSQTDDLFRRVLNVNFTVLPHKPSSGAECYVHFYFRSCSACDPIGLAYNDARQVTPEMDDVWKWFDALVPATTALSPRNYCRF